MDDGIGAFRNRQHADSFLAHINSLTPDLQYTIEHPSSDGTLPFLDVLIHPDKSTSVYRKPTHTNLYIQYNSCTPNNTKDSVIRSLTRRAYNLCSPQHLDEELQTVWKICMKNGFPPQRINRVMEDTQRSLKKTQHPTATSKEPKSPSYALQITLPYHPILSKPIKKSLQNHDIKVKHSSNTNLRNILTQTKTPTPGPQTPNVIYEIPCDNCDAFYNGQTKRPLLKRIKEHEANFRLQNNVHESTGRIKSAPSHHALTAGHTMRWNDTSILATTAHPGQLDLIEHAAIQTRKPYINRTDKLQTSAV